MPPLSEFQLIDRFVRGSPRAGAGVALGIGDDAAVLRPPPGEELVATVDALVEGVHFDGRFTPEEVGWKALAVNLSDVAAMGARPLWALCGLAVVRGSATERLVRVGRGLGACARRFGVALVGGNVTRARQLSITTTLIGALPRGTALTRSGGRPGDVLLVSGALGGAALGLRRGAPPEAVRRQRRPVPRVELGLALRDVASACVDLSDGLLQDLGHLCRASRVGAELEVADLPAEAGVRGRRDAARLLLAGGEDYELLVAVPPARLGRALDAGLRLGAPLRPIGCLCRGRSIRLIDAGGLRVATSRGGYDHLLDR